MAEDLQTEADIIICRVPNADGIISHKLLVIKIIMNIQNKRFGSLSSSENPEQLAATVKSIILALASTIILVAGSFGVSIAQEEMVQVAMQISLAISSIWFLYGIIRKVIIRFAKK